jgi:hypothetical protein
VSRLRTGGLEVLHLHRHLGGHHPLHGELVDQPLRRRSGQHGVEAVRAATHVLRSSNLVDTALERCHLHISGIDRRHVCSVLGIGRLLRYKLVLQIELRRVHGLGGFLGLPRQFVQFCQRIGGGVGVHTPGERTPEDHEAGYRTYDRSSNTTCAPVRAVKPQDLRPSTAVASR